MMTEVFGIFSFFYEPAVSHDKPGAADHSSVDRDAQFDRIPSTYRTES